MSSRCWDGSDPWSEGHGTEVAPYFAAGSTRSLPLYQVAMGMVGEIGGVDLGFGTSRPFEVVGASWLEAEKVARRLNDYQLTGVRFSAIKSVVGRGSQKGRTLPAVKVDIIDASSAPLTPVNLFVIEAIRLAQGRDMMQIQTKAGKNGASLTRSTARMPLVRTCSMADR